MKRTLPGILTLCLLLTLTACVGTTDAPQPNLRGTIANGVYTNEYLNLKVTLPEGWTFADGEALAELNNTVLELWNDTDYEQAIQKVGNVLDMMESDENGNSVNLNIQTAAVNLDKYTDAQLFESAEETTRAQAEAAGFGLNTYEVVELTVGGETRSVLHMVLTIDREALDEYQIIYRGSGKYYGMLTIAVKDTYLLQSLLDSIVRIKK